jgi:hypothetical protein
LRLRRFCTHLIDNRLRLLPRNDRPGRGLCLLGKNRLRKRRVSLGRRFRRLCLFLFVKCAVAPLGDVTEGRELTALGATVICS